LRVNAERLGRLARILRVRQHFTQVALAARAGVSRRAVTLLERGYSRRLRLETVEAIVSTLGGRIDVRLLWNGPELDRLLDEGHAGLGAMVKRRLERWGWLVRIEVTYSEWGERGRIDLLAFHPATRQLLVVELKTMLVDVQALLGTLDAKARLARSVVDRFGWDPVAVVPAVVFAEDRTTRNRLARLANLFDRFELRGRPAITWLRHPSSHAAPTGLLWFSSVGPTRQVAARRVRPGASSASSTAESAT
jgi:transcriptional regulator with XRE-family HTH domain